MLLIVPSAALHSVAYVITTVPSVCSQDTFGPISVEPYKANTLDEKAAIKMGNNLYFMMLSSTIRLLIYPC